jgi:hypothetical protein
MAVVERENETRKMRATKGRRRKEKEASNGATRRQKSESGVNL